ncbi:MAG TPA: hypothetical protein VII50_05750, partial [Acidothermaceae bacterium]
MRRFSTVFAATVAGLVVLLSLKTTQAKAPRPAALSGVTPGDSSTPLNSSAPASSAPVSSAPVSSAPVSSAPVSSAPAGAPQPSTAAPSSSAATASKVSPS